MANSKYLDIVIKKEILNESAEGLVEDVRFNKPAKDGEQFTEEGIYTITVKNEYTEQQTVKKIYVGTNDVLKAHVATGFSIEEIKYQISLGATVGEDGKLIPVANQTPTESQPTQSDDSTNDPVEPSNYTMYIIIGGAALLVIVLVVIIVANKAKKKKTSLKEGGKEE